MGRRSDDATAVDVEINPQRRRLTRCNPQRGIEVLEDLGLKNAGCVTLCCHAGPSRGGVGEAGLVKRASALAEWQNSSLPAS